MTLLFLLLSRQHHQLLLLLTLCCTGVCGRWQVYQMTPQLGDNETRLALRLNQVLTSNDPVSLDSFSLCLWFKVVTFLDLSSLLSYALSDKDDDVINIFARPEGVEVNYDGTNVQHSLPLRPLWWYPACLVVEPSSLAVWVSSLQQQKGPRGTTTTSPLALNGSLVLGQEQDEPDGGYNSNQAFVGHVTGVTLWSSALRPDQLLAWSLCTPLEEPSLLAWDDLSWTIHNSSGGVRNHSDSPCVDGAPADDELLLFTNKMTWRKARKYLEQVGLAMAAPHSSQERRQVARLFALYHSQCTDAYSEGVNIWLGVLVNNTNHRVVDVNNQEITDVPWSRQSHKSAGLFSATPVSQDQDELWHKENQYKELCFVGKSAEPPSPLRLGGLCDDDKSQLSHDLNFILSGTQAEVRHNNNSSVYLHGYKNLHIIKDNNKSKWCLVQLHNINTSPTTTILACSVSDGPPLGRLNWRIESSNICNNVVNKTLYLALSTCTPDHYTCSDSTCIHLSKLCDNMFDCSDGIDERDCFTCFPPPGYLAALPPEIPVNMTVDVEVTRIGNTDLLASALDLHATFTVTWTDARLQFRHLRDKSDDALTKVVLSPQHRVWLPTLWMERGVLTERDVEDNLRVQRLGNGTVVSGAYVSYSGLDNPLVMTVAANMVIQCQLFNLKMYPWDQQHCDAQVKVSKFGESGVRVAGGSRVLSCPGRLVEYDVLKCDLQPAPGGLNLTLVLARRFEYHVWATYLPTSLLLTIGYGTLFLPVERFPERGGMSLTTLLVFISLYTETSSSLPKTSYLKLIDLWFVLNITYLSLIIVIHLITCRTTQKDNQQVRKRRPPPDSTLPLFIKVLPQEPHALNHQRSRQQIILKSAQIALGTFIVIFFLGYFIAAELYNRYNQHLY